MQRNHLLKRGVIFIFALCFIAGITTPIFSQSNDKGKPDTVNEQKQNNAGGNSNGNGNNPNNGGNGNSNAGGNSGDNGGNNNGNNGDNGNAGGNGGDNGNNGGNNGNNNGNNGGNSGDNGNAGGNGGDNGNNGGNSGGNADVGENAQITPAATTSVSQTLLITPTAVLLGCQRNNPSRLDCSSLAVSGVCEGTVAVFTIKNTGEAGNGDMRAATEYRILQDGVLVQTGSVQLAGNSSTTIRYEGSGTITLQADQQIGHPGSSEPRVSLDCGGSNPTEEPTVAPTEEPTVTVEPTEEPTIEPTETLAPTKEPTLTPEPWMNVSGYCYYDYGYPVIKFVISNGAVAMDAPASYSVFDASGVTIDQYYIQLDAYTSITLEYFGYETLTLTLLQYISTPMCVPATEEPTPSSFTLDGSCVDETIYFRIYNDVGEDMFESLPYLVSDESGTTIDEGWLWLAGYQMASLSYSGYARLTLQFAGLTYTVDCAGVVVTEEPTIEPTEEPTVTVEPTEEPTVTVEPTEEPTIEPTEEPTVTVEPTEEPTVAPTEEPTVEPTVTPDGQLGCQVNNPTRLDCSSLQVKVYCDGGDAVFVITNTGEAGNGDMRAATDYVLVLNGVVIASGDVLLDGGDSMEVRYEGTGQVTLLAEQQIGHPGKSQPRATIACRL